MSDAGELASPSRAGRGHAARQGGRWSPRATLAVSGGIGLLIWGVIALAVSAIR